MKKFSELTPEQQERFAMLERVSIPHARLIYDLYLTAIDKVWEHQEKYYWFQWGSFSITYKTESLQFTRRPDPTDPTDPGEFDIYFEGDIEVYDSEDELVRELEFNTNWGEVWHKIQF